MYKGFEPPGKNGSTVNNLKQRRQGRALGSNRSLGPGLAQLLEKWGSDKLKKGNKLKIRHGTYK